MVREYDEKILGKVEIPEDWVKSMRYVKSDGTVIAKRPKPLSPEVLKAREEMELKLHKQKRDKWNKVGAGLGLPPMADSETIVEYIKKICVEKRKRLNEEKVKRAEARILAKKEKEEKRKAEKLAKIEEMERKLAEKKKLLS